MEPWPVSPNQGPPQVAGPHPLQRPPARPSALSCGSDELAVLLTPLGKTTHISVWEGVHPPPYPGTLTTVPLKTKHIRCKAERIRTGLQSFFYCCFSRWNYCIYRLKKDTKTLKWKNDEAAGPKGVGLDGRDTSLKHTVLFVSFRHVFVFVVKERQRNNF